MSMRNFLIRHALQPIPAALPANSPPIEKLPDWLVNHWAKPNITAREIQIYGPNCTRDRETALSLAESLAGYGWLNTITARRRDTREWQIVRKPNT